MRRFILLALVIVIITVACGGGESGGGSNGGGPSVQTPRPNSSATAAAEATRTFGPTATVDPRQGPPGTTLFIDGAGWTPGGTVTIMSGEANDASARPLATTTVRLDGSFSVRFLLEKTASGGELRAGPYALVAREDQDSVRLTFQVQSTRPVPPTRTGG